MTTETFTLWQLPGQTRSQMMSYVIQTVNGKVMVVDGGMQGDAPYLKSFLEALGNRIEVWFLSHMDRDHVDALSLLLLDESGPEISEIVTTLPSPEWLEGIGDPSDPARRTRTLLTRAAWRSIPVRDAEMGEEFSVDGVQAKILRVCNPEIRTNAMNNSSLVWRMWDDHKSILFTGDIGPEAAQNVLDGPFRDCLQSEYVQMAHHGQRGAHREFYQEVGARYCLWPTPQWLWDNDNGGGNGSGPWETLTVRGWMDDLKIEKHYVCKDGLAEIR